GDDEEAVLAFAGKAAARLAELEGGTLRSEALEAEAAELRRALAGTGAPPAPRPAAGGRPPGRGPPGRAGRPGHAQRPGGGRGRAGPRRRRPGGRRALPGRHRGRPRAGSTPP